MEAPERELERPELAALLAHLEREFGRHGVRAVGFLRTATYLVGHALEAGRENLRLAETVAYCLREALVELPKLAGVDLRTISAISGDVVTAWRLFESTRELPGIREEDTLGRVSALIGELDEARRQETVHQRRLIAVFVRRTGVEPFRFGEENPVDAYQRLLDRVNDILHQEGTLDEVVGLYRETVELLLRLFAPPIDRHDALVELASSTTSPTQDDVDRLLSLVANAHHLAIFFQRVVSPEWLTLLWRRGQIPPPQPPWPVSQLIANLGRDHGPFLAAWLEEALDRWASDPAHASLIAREAEQLGAEGRAVVVRALERHPFDRWMEGVAVQAALEADPTDTIVERVLDLTFNEFPHRTLTGHSTRLLEHFLAGASEGNVLHRVQLLVYKVRRLIREDPYEWSFRLDPAPITAPLDRRAPPVAFLVQALVELLRRAGELGRPTPTLLERLTALEEPLRSRIRAQHLRTADDVDHAAQIEEIARSIGERDPTGDDLQLVQAIVKHGGEDGLERWRAALGVPPEVSDLESRLRRQDIPSDWHRAWRWYVVLPPSVVEPWNEAAEVLAGALGVPADRSQLLRREPLVELEAARSPMAHKELAALPPREAARRVAEWRPDPDRWLVVARELARILQAVAGDGAAQWAENPMELVEDLRHPTYVGHYFDGLREAKEEIGGAAERIVEAVAFARSHPWEVEVLGDDDFDYDPDWSRADQAGVDLLGALASVDAAFGTRLDEAWGIVLAAARDRSAPSGVGGTEEPMQTAINRPCTRALQAAISLAGWEYRRSGEIRPQFFELLEEALVFDGRDGLEHRAILASVLPFLVRVAEPWVERHRDLLFGSEAPNDLGQATLELTIKWARPSRWLLEQERGRLLQAALRGEERAVAYVLLGTLWGVPTYEADSLVRELSRDGAEAFGRAGGEMARLVQTGDVPPEYLERAVAFWRRQLEESNLPPHVYRPFGAWAFVRGVDETRWRELTLTTLARAQGSVDFASEVAERAAQEPIAPEALEILRAVFRGSDEPWERHRIASVALKVLRDNRAEPSVTDVRDSLRNALIEAGYTEARQL